MARPELCKVVGERRLRVERLPVERRLLGFDEVAQLPTLEQAQAEARRCAASTICRYCDVCQLLCPDLAITRDPETRRILIDLDYCKGCGLCAHYCPHDAIVMVVDE